MTPPLLVLHGDIKGCTVANQACTAVAGAAAVCGQPTQSVQRRQGADQPRGTAGRSWPL